MGRSRKKQKRLYEQEIQRIKYKQQHQRRKPKKRRVTPKPLPPQPPLTLPPPPPKLVHLYDFGEGVFVQILTFLDAEHVITLRRVDKRFKMLGYKALSLFTRYVVNLADHKRPERPKKMLGVLNPRRIRHLNLVGNTIDPPKISFKLADLERTMLLFRNAKSLVLRVGVPTATVEDMKSLSRHLGVMKKLESLTLNTFPLNVCPDLRYCAYPRLREFIARSVRVHGILHLLTNCPHLYKVHLHQAIGARDLYILLMDRKSEHRRNRVPGETLTHWPQVTDLLIEFQLNPNRRIVNTQWVPFVLKAFPKVEKLTVMRTVIPRATLVDAMLGNKNLKDLTITVTANLETEKFKMSSLVGLEPVGGWALEAYHEYQPYGRKKVSRDALGAIVKVFPKLRVLDLTAQYYDAFFVKMVKLLENLEHLYLYENHEYPNLCELFEKDCCPKLKKITVVMSTQQSPWEYFFDVLETKRPDLQMVYTRLRSLDVCKYEDFMR